jgi:hypothetical protein
MTRENELESRLLAVHKRLQWLADQEARAAWLNGYGANGEHEAERERLISSAESLVDEMDKLRTSKS